MLLSNPKLRVVAVDIGIHKYVRPCYDYLVSLFGEDRIKIYWGDSRDMLADKNNPDFQEVDLFHIDGGHQVEVASADLKNCYELARNEALVVFDDTNVAWLNALWTSYVEAEKIRDLTGTFEKGGFFKHAIVTFIKK